MYTQWTRVLYFVVITRQPNPPIPEFNSPYNEFTSVCSTFVYNGIFYFCPIFYYYILLRLILCWTWSINARVCRKKWTIYGGNLWKKKGMEYNCTLNYLTFYLDMSHINEDTVGNVLLKKRVG